MLEFVPQKGRFCSTKFAGRSHLSLYWRSIWRKAYWVCSFRLLFVVFFMVLISGAVGGGGVYLGCSLMCYGLNRTLIEAAGDQSMMGVFFQLRNVLSFDECSSRPIVSIN
ncbi:hypothetical protein NE237_013802 [Protea cynaroides]|uniref:Transmembrane protein n=1 Tax=Protea cynaroides TaxID=273540 RepID=A0A9Q0JY79_9MAGN|nr:hypothetical protein NE237_013802 [Protea cynaroides]